MLARGIDRYKSSCVGIAEWYDAVVMFGSCRLFADVDKAKELYDVDVDEQCCKKGSSVQVFNTRAGNVVVTWQLQDAMTIRLKHCNRERRAQ